MKKLCAILITTGLVSGTASNAADYPLAVKQCIPMEQADLLLIDSISSLTDEVVRMMNEAVSVAEDPRWISYSRPTFVWASEAKVACGKAYGYLKSDYRDDQYLNKCECFYERMQHYLN
jgi:hypothetical protein